jgi:hypothetical protein
VSYHNTPEPPLFFSFLFFFLNYKALPFFFVFSFFLVYLSGLWDVMTSEEAVDFVHSTLEMARARNHDNNNGGDDDDDHNDGDDDLSEEGDLKRSMAECLTREVRRRMSSSVTFQLKKIKTKDSMPSRH